VSLHYNWCCLLSPTGGGGVRREVKSSNWAAILLCFEILKWTTDACHKHILRFCIKSPRQTCGNCYYHGLGLEPCLMDRYDHDNKRPRGFGFVTFITEEGVDAVFTEGSLQTLHDKPIEIKRAVPRDQIATARGRPNFSSSPRLFPTGQAGHFHLFRQGTKKDIRL